MPTDLVASTDQRFVYVANSQTDSIGVIDVRTRSIVKEITVGAIPVRSIRGFLYKVGTTLTFKAYNASYVGKWWR